MTGSEGVMCVLSSVTYMVEGIVGVSGSYKNWIRFAFDTRAGFNIFRRNALPYDLEEEVDGGAIPPWIKDDNGNPLELGEFLCLKKRLGNNVLKFGTS